MLYRILFLLALMQTKFVILSGQTFVTNDILECTFKIQTDTQSGTGFLIGRPDSNFMITARHLFRKSYKNGDKIVYWVYGKDSWEAFDGTLLLHKNPKVDIAIIKPDSIGKWNPTLNSNLPAMFLGEDAIFLGFPYDIIPSRKMADVELYYPYPIFKKAMNCENVESDSIIYYLFEGHNNSGFSGGPILLKSWKQKPLPTYNRLIAVVHGFYPGALTLDTDKGKMIFAENSGIMLGVPAFYITEIFEQNGYFNVW